MATSHIHHGTIKLVSAEPISQGTCKGCLLDPFNHSMYCYEANLNGPTGTCNDLVWLAESAQDAAMIAALVALDDD